MSEEKKDYSCTLNLPKTDFPMRGNLPTKEPETLKAVFENGLYEKILKKNEGHKHFVLHDGPPYANGEIHAGHALNKILKDTIVRYKAMKGFYAPFIPGYDTHGMPTEKKAIEKLGLDRSKIPVTKFRDTCREFTTNYKDIQTEGFKRLGVLGDWAHPYITYDHATEARQIGVFGDMYKKGYIYKGLKPVYWCTDCETALAEAEIEYKDVTGESIYVKFPVEDSKGLFDKKDTYMVIWTTTPWTLPGNMGITIGADYEYSMVELKENKENSKLERLIIATELVEKVMKLAEVEDYKTVQTFKGSELEGVLCKHPFLDRMSRVVLGSETTVNVTLDEGTGAVHTAPAYGKEDYLQGLKDKLGMVVAVDDKGKQTAEAGEFAGQFYAKSNKTITAWLDENGYLLKAVKIEHSYPHCWRCKKPIIFRATPQWFASVDGFRDDVLKAIKTVTWHPDWGEDRMSEMIKGRNDWCISRQRTWGVPLPIFYCKDCGEPYVTEESIKKIQDVVRTEGTNAWWAKEAKDLVPEGAKCPKCGCTEFKKETDIMDVWFDSGSTHQSVLVERGLDYPADLYLEGNDQYRGWFQSSLLTSVAVNGIAPYKEVLCCGFVVDGQGRKMSKSLGNGVSPIDVSNKFGADILRLWALSSDYSMDVNLSDDILKGISDVYRKIRNTARYILGNTYDYDPEKPVAYEDLQEIDKWALTRLNKLIKDCTNDYDTYSFGNCYHDVNQFCVVDMSSFYLDIIKDRLYTEKADSVARRAAQTTMYYILDALVKILTPMISFTAEEIWSAMNHTEKENVESPMLADYPVSNDEWDNKEIAEKWEKIIKVKNIVAKDLELARAEKTIGNSLDAKVTIYAEGEEYKFLKENEELIKLVLIVSGLEIQENNRKQEEKLGVKVEHATGEKCERCWMYNDHIEDGLCPRCKEVLEK
ncbi:isoleucine--tRNA ligase [Clostridium sp. CAG:245]|nr:isoleucine--tRNA ligase [Clostridium sp. CAG:245]